MRDLVARFRKLLAAVAGAVVSAGGVAVFLPALPAVSATLITTVVTGLSVALAPQNENPAPGLASDE